MFFHWSLESQKIKQLVKRPQQILTNYGHISWKSYEQLNSYDYVFRLSGFSDLYGKVFLITFKFSYLDFSMIFRKSNVNKTVNK